MIQYSRSVRYPSEGNGAFDPRGLRQMCMQACLPDSLPAGINQERHYL